MTGGAVAAVFGWPFGGHPDLPDPVGRWANGAVSVELLPGGGLGVATVPVSVCASEAADASATVALRSGTWTAMWESDAGYLVVVEAVRSDNGAGCSIWLGRSADSLWMPTRRGIDLTRV
ncbi:hypothetical protein [Kitasatospora sp. NPDC091207]|uniref:hypothetical protein n=1 Tax=Kitasatospora sp. NPDC091207 TaxID=3364083 RepID=UPI00381FB8A7